MVSPSSVLRFGACALLGLLVGCSQPAPAAPKSAGPAAQPTPALTARAMDTIPRAQASPSPQVAASPVAPQTGPTTGAKVEPKGQVTYVWHTSIAPAWFDPQENPALITPYGFQYAIHDAVAKNLPGKPFAPSLAESYDIAPDFKSATFKLRPGITFHNGDPVTAEDVKFTFEKYRGTQAQVLHAKTDHIETPDARTVKFVFKEPFLDFLTLYGSPASGAGWVVPKKYYEQVGPNGFKQKPIGAGPYKFVSLNGDTLTLEAFTSYWRKTPSVKTIIIRGISEDSTRVATLESGESDFVNLIVGPLIDTVKNDPKVQLAPILTVPFYLEFPGSERPDNQFHDARVRQAVSLALDRKAISAAEEGGLSGLIGNWIPPEWPGAVKRPKPEEDLTKAKQLMADAGVPNGFDGGSITPLPNYFSLAERVATQLRQIGIELKVNQMERGAYAAKLGEGEDAFPKGLVLNISGLPGDAAGRFRAYALCPPKGSNSRTCDPHVDQEFAKYEASIDLKERERLITDLQNYVLDKYLFVPIYQQAFINAIGPRIANQKDTVYGAVPQYAYVSPFEDIQLKP